MARTLSNRAANDVSPDVLADEARAIAKRYGLWIDVIDEVRAAELGMGMFLAVGRGSDNPPRMIVLRSGGVGERDALDRHLAIVGKGVCFDSGGISIKPSDRMDEMKMDKTGACTVIAAIATVARLAPGTPLLALAPAVENMPGPHSTRPGTSSARSTARWSTSRTPTPKGGLILGDAMTYAEQLGATHIVDVATLTGAVSRALGHLVTGAFGQPQDFYDDVMAAGGPRGRALLAAAADRRLRAGHGQLVRRPPELRLGRGFARQERPLPARVRDEAVGPPRHRRDRLLPQGPAVRVRAGRPACRTRRSSSWRWRAPAPTDRPGRRSRAADTAERGRIVNIGELQIGWREVVAALLGVAGFVLGFAADRFATRWPEHDEEHPPDRIMDWRTAVTALLGAVALGLLPLRFWGDPLAMALFGAWFVTLIVGLATDLDQRMLPDELTLPVIPIALVYAVSGLNPFVGANLVLAIVAAIGIPLVLYLPSIPFGAGAFGIGDVKLLVGVGLMSGAGRAFSGVLFGLVVAGVVLLALLVTRRIGRRSVRPVRAVPDRRRTVGRAHPGVTGRLASPRGAAWHLGPGAPRTNVRLGCGARLARLTGV